MNEEIKYGLGTISSFNEYDELKAVGRGGFTVTQLFSWLISLTDWS